jgi:hypothetical protein
VWTDAQLLHRTSTPRRTGSSDRTNSVGRRTSRTSSKTTGLPARQEGPGRATGPTAQEEEQAGRPARSRNSTLANHGPDRLPNAIPESHYAGHGSGQYYPTQGRETLGRRSEAQVNKVCAVRAAPRRAEGGTAARLYRARVRVYVP